MHHWVELKVDAVYLVKNYQTSPLQKQRVREEVANIMRLILRLSTLLNVTGSQRNSGTFLTNWLPKLSILEKSQSLPDGLS